MSSSLRGDGIKRKQFRNLAREKRRSLSMDNIEYHGNPQGDSAEGQDENPSLLNTTPRSCTDTQPGNKFKVMKKKLSNIMTKSTQDLHCATDENAANYAESNNLVPAFPGNNILDQKSSPRGVRKQKINKRNQTELCNSSSEVVDHSTSRGSKFSMSTNDSDNSIIHHGSLDSNDHYMAYDSGGNYETDDIGSTYETDETDGAALADQKIEKLWRKIEKTREDLIQLQSIKDENVSDYLKITDNPSETTINAKTKLNFERNNQKTNNGIQILQRKLEKYQQQLKEIEENGVHGPKRIIKVVQVVQDSVRSGASSITGVVAKPLESLNNFIKKDKKNSSLDNVYITVTGDDDENFYHSIQTTSDEENFSNSTSNLMKESVLQNIQQKLNSSTETRGELDLLKCRVNEIEKENQEGKQNVDQFKERLNWALQSLQEEKYKTEQLQVRLNDLYNQWNDLTELHQNEMMGMKDEMDRTMERIECVEYRFTERTADLEENVENCVTRITKMEKQQQEQQQPIDSFLDIDSKMLMSKLLTLVINFCVVIIFVVTSLTRLVMPFVSNRSRLVASAVAITAIVVIWKNADHVVSTIRR